MKACRRSRLGVLSITVLRKVGYSKEPGEFSRTKNLNGLRSTQMYISLVIKALILSRRIC